MKILIRLPNWLGDLIMSTAFLERIAEIYPHAEIHVIVKEELKDLIGLIPLISKAYPFSKKKFKGLKGQFRFARDIEREEKYDFFFSLPDSFSSAFIGFFSGAKKRIGFRGEGRGLLLTHTFRKPAGLHRTDEYLFLLNEFSQSPQTKGKVRIRSAGVSLNGLNLPAKFILFNAASEAQSRTLPQGYAVELGEALIKEFQLPLVFSGTMGSLDYHNSIIGKFTNPSFGINLSGKTTLSGLTKLTESAELVITTDSGPAHLANAVGQTAIVLFGAGNESNTGPYNRENAHVLRTQLHCTPCLSNICRYGTTECLTAIGVTPVVEKARQIMRTKVGRLG